MKHPVIFSAVLILYSSALLQAQDLYDCSSTREISGSFPDFPGMKTPFLRSDGGLLIYAAEEDDRSVLYWSAVLKREWQKPARVFPETPADESHLYPFLSPDGKELFFTSVSKNTAESRIMVSRLENGRFRNRKALESPVNTGYGEAAFILSPYRDGAFLSSRRPGGKGGWDIWFIPLTGGSFGVPINPGFPLNSDSDEADISSQGGGVYRFLTWRNGEPVYCSIAEPDLSYTLNIVLSDIKNNKPIESDIKISAGRGTTPEGTPFAGGTVRTDDTGRAQFRVHYTVTEAQISVNAPDYLPWFGSAEIQKYAEKEYRAELTPIKKNVSFAVRSIQFGYNSAEITRDSTAVLESFAEHLRQNPNVRYEISGHTDLKGSHAFNNKLSQARADSVREFLISKGIAPERLIAKGKGRTEPIRAERSPEADALNRRTEFRVISHED